MTELAIKIADPADAAEIAELGASTFRATYKAYNTPDNMAAYIADSFRPETILEELEDRRSAYLLARRGDVNIGFAKVRHSEVPDCVTAPNPIELERIYVRSDQQGSGVGALLMKAVVEYARTEGCGTVWLGVWERNIAAQGFYENQGFEYVGHKTFRFGINVQNDLVMSRRLD
jgi:GNAT superfamily N-acetyltransferase